MLTPTAPIVAAAEETDLERFRAGKPGVYRGIPAQDYHALDACSASRLKSLRRSAAHCLYDMENPNQTDALIRGSATHLLVLEPDLFVSHFAVAEQCSAVQKNGAACSSMGKYRVGGQWLCGRHGEPVVGATPVLGADDYRTCRDISMSVRLHPAAQKMLTAKGETELSLVWIDPPTELLCKARVDKYDEARRVIYDLKTTTNAGPEGFAKSIYEFGYAIQAAHYIYGCERCGIDANIFGFIAVESNPPHPVAVYQLEHEDVVLGFAEREMLMTQYAKCKRDDEWPGYSDQATKISMPKWAREKIREATFNRSQS